MSRAVLWFITTPHTHSHFYIPPFIAAAASLFARTLSNPFIVSQSGSGHVPKCLSKRLSRGPAKQPQLAGGLSNTPSSLYCTSSTHPTSTTQHICRAKRRKKAAFKMTKSPQWLDQSCSTFLTAFLKKKKNFIAVYSLQVYHTPGFSLDRILKDKKFRR